MRTSPRVRVFVDRMLEIFAAAKLEKQKHERGQQRRAEGKDADGGSN